MSEAASAYVTLIPSARGFGSALTRQVGSAGDSAGQAFSGRFSSSVSRALKNVALYGGAYQAFRLLGQGLGQAGKAIFGFNSQLQQSKIAFTTMLGSGKAAQSFLNQLKSFARSTPFEFSGLTQNSQLLLGMGIQAKDLIPTMRALGDSAASVGANQDTLNNTILAFGQIAAKGTLSMDNMNQLLQGGVPTALKVLAAQFHVTTGQMVQMISTGKVQSSVALPLLVKGLEKGTSATKALGGMMDKQSQTFSGAMSNIGDALTQGLAKIGAPLFKRVSKGAQEFATALSSPAFNRFAKQLSRELGKGLDAVMGAFDRLRGNLPQIEAKLTPIANAAVRLGESLKSAFLKAIPAVESIVKALAPMAGGLLVAAFKALSVAASVLGNALSVVGGFAAQHAATFRVLAGVVLAGVAAWKIYTTTMAVVRGIQVAFTAAQWLLNAALTANPIGLIVVGLAALGAAFVLAYKKSTTFRNIVNGAFSGVKAAASAVASFFTQKIPAAFHAVTSAAQTVLGWVKGHWPLLLAILTGPFGLAVAVIAKNWDKIKAGATNVVDFFKAFPAKIKAALGDLGGLLVHAGQELIDGLIRGITSKISAVGNAVKSVASKVKGFFPGSPVKEGPLKSWNNGGAGKRLMDLLAAGIKAAASAPVSATARVTSTLDKAVQSLQSHMGDFPKAVQPGLKKLADSITGITSRLKDLMSQAANIASSVVQAFTPSDLFSGSLTDLMTGLVGWTNNITAAAAAFKTLSKANLNKGFLNAVMGSGNAALIEQLAASPQTARALSREYAQASRATSSLGKKVGSNAVGARIDETNRELRALRKDVQHLAAQTGAAVGKEINGSSRSAKTKAQLLAATKPKGRR